MTDPSAVPADAAPPPAAGPSAGPGAAGNAAYRVLARKYRPATFDEVIGQEALVRTLTNAIAAGRLAHAFVLTGVRGVGKTTTARILARALNCLGPDGTRTAPTVTPCGVCEACRAIAADRHVDVLEMDAASRTGVDDIREILDGVRYAPASARHKVYIIDEVHMLSKNAFNALLKTLEEPPPHTVFIFATTEIRKVPVTVLSRCQRFDLRRVEIEVLTRHFADIARREGVAAEAEALAMVARAADGSVRDGLSLLDQAIAQSGGIGPVTAAQVRDMLGLADRTAVLDLFDVAIRGRGPEALAQLDALHRAGADPLAVLQDLLEFTHLLTRLRLVPALAERPGLPEAERVRGAKLAEALSVPVLTRAWQILLKGLGQVQQAPSPAAALDMVLIRLIHAADLPTPDEAIRRLTEGGAGAGPSSAPPGAGASGTGARAESGPRFAGAPLGDPPQGGRFGTGPAAAALAPAVAASRAGEAWSGPGGALRAAVAEPAGAPPGVAAAPSPAPAPAPAVTLAGVPEDFHDLVAMFGEQGDPLVYGHLVSSVHLVRYQPGRLEFRPGPGAPPNLAAQVMAQLQDWTGQRWMVGVSRDEGEPTLAEQGRAAERRAMVEAAEHPVVRAVLAAFPGAMIAHIRDREPPPSEAGLAVAAAPGAVSQPRADTAGGPGAEPLDASESSEVFDPDEMTDE